MSDKVTYKDLDKALIDWAPRFNLIRKEWPGASVEEVLSILKIVEKEAKEKKEEDKSPMGFKDQKGT
jgi:cell division protein YceG involved in septum cleavage